MYQLPYVIDVFLIPIRDNPQAQVVVCAAMLLMLIDILMGLLNAVIHGEYSSDIMRQGIAHKAVELCFILLAVIIDATIISGVNLGFTAPVIVAVGIYIIVMEAGSLLETSVKIWPKLENQPILKFLKMIQPKEQENE